MVNAELVSQGYSQVATVPPNVKYAERFRQLQREDRAQLCARFKSQFQG
jgi:micrococcal nuclease